MSEFLKSVGRPLGLLLFVGSYAGAADASSFVELKPPAGAAPSILMLGQTPKPVDVVYLPALTVDPNVAVGQVDPPQPGVPENGSIVTLSRSIIAMGEPDVVDEKVAAIGGTSGPRDETPMVIRGGIVGDAFSPPAPAPAETPKPSDGGASQSGQSSGEAGQPEQPSAPAQPSAADAAKAE